MLLSTPMEAAATESSTTMEATATAHATSTGTAVKAGTAARRRSARKITTVHLCKGSLASTAGDVWPVGGPVHPCLTAVGDGVPGSVTTRTTACLIATAWTIAGVKTIAGARTIAGVGTQDLLAIVTTEIHPFGATR